MLQNWWRIKNNCLPVEERICLNTMKLVYKRLHDQNFPYQLKLRCKIIIRDSRRKQFKENNAEYEKSTIFEKDCPKILIIYPMTFIQKSHFQLSKTNHRQFAWIKVCLEIPSKEGSDRPVDTVLKLRVCKTFRCRSRYCGYILNVWFAINLCPLSKVNACFRDFMFENSFQ